MGDEVLNQGNGAVDPVDLPTDPDLKLCYVIGDLLREKAQSLKLGDRDELVELASWLVRSVEGGGIVELPRPGQGVQALGPCVSCATCKVNFQNCTGTYAQCKAAYDACVRCPCTL